MQGDLSFPEIRSRLLYPHRNFEPDAEQQWNHDDLTGDLEIGTILDAMAANDQHIREVCLATFLSPIHNEEGIRYRQDSIKDALHNRDAVREMQSLLMDTIRKAHEKWFWMSRTSKNPEFTLHEALSILETYLDSLDNLRHISSEYGKSFNSRGFSALFSLFTEVFDSEYSQALREAVSRLQFPHGVKVMGGLGARSELTGFRLLMPSLSKGVRETITHVREKKYTYVLPPRDEQGPLELSNIRAQAIMPVVNVLEEASVKVLNFIKTLSSELSFLIGCINLAEKLESMEAPFCFPEPEPEKNSFFQFSDLYDMALCLNMGRKGVPNSLPACNQALTIITGANRGGKSTFLRSIGQGTVMMQAGMFVGARDFSSSLFNGVFTHFRRGEDRGMEKGKFDEELGRMDSIVDHLGKGSLILFNESFSATNAREGSEIAGEILKALAESGITAVFVTHLNELAEYLSESFPGGIRFLSAERTAKGERTFRILPGKPEKTSYGSDIFFRVFRQALEEESFITQQGDR